MKTGMQALHFMVGDWAIQAHNINATGEWIPSALPRETTIKSVFEEAFLQEDEVSIMAGDTVIRFFIMWSYDTYRETYRMLACDDQEGLADILEGNFEAGTDTITVNNLNTGTHRLDEQGNPVYLQLISTKNSEHSFNDEIQESADGGKTWNSIYRAAHTRKS
jgi:hypothetical protein